MRTKYTHTHTQQDREEVSLAESLSYAYTHASCLYSTTYLLPIHCYWPHQPCHQGPAANHGCYCLPSLSWWRITQHYARLQSWVTVVTHFCTATERQGSLTVSPVTVTKKRRSLQWHWWRGKWVKERERGKRWRSKERPWFHWCEKEN